MALVPLGLVTVSTAGTPVPCISTWTPCNSIFIQQNSNNGGAIYVGVAGMNKSTLVGVLAVLPAPGAGSLPAFSSAIVTAANAINLKDIYLDADTSGNSALVSYAQV